MFAVAAVALAVMARRGGPSLLFSAELQFLPFFVAVLAVSWLGDPGPALVCSILGFFAMVRLQPDMNNPASMISYFIVSLPIVLLGYLNRKAKVQREALRQREEQMRLFVENAPAAIAMLDNDMRYVAASRRWVKDYHIEGRKLLGRSHYEIFPEIGQGWKDIHKRCLAGKVEHAEEDRFVRKDGSVQWLRWDVRPWYRGSGDIGGLIMFTEDITDRKKAEEKIRASEERLRLALDIAEAGTWEWEPGTDKSVWSGRTWELFGLNPHCCEPSYDEWIKVVVPDDRAKVQNVIREAVERKSDLLVEFRVHNGKGNRWLMSRGGCVHGREGEVLRYIGMVIDVTTRKKAEQVLKRDNEALERLVRQRTSSLLDAERKLDKAKRLSDIGTLASTVAHELRNPLSAIGMASFNIKRHADIPSVRQSLFTIEKKISEGDQIINNLLFYSRLKKPSFEPVDVFGEIGESIGHVKTMLPENVRLDVRTGALKGVIIEADPLQLKELCSNIMNNAIDAVRKRGDAVIMISGRRQDGWVLIEIRDNGVGMSEETVKRAMEPFYSTKSRGTGLGLAVSRQIAELHGGTLSLSSTEGKGTTVTITLPVKGR